MIRILANDGIHAAGKKLLADNGFDLVDKFYPQEELPHVLKDFDVLLVRSATTVRMDLIDTCPNLKMVGRGGVGVDNIDVKYAESKGIKVFNTPAASSQSVAELVFAHIFAGSRFLYDSNRKMPVNGQTDFKGLKKQYSKGMELKDKTIGIIGFGRIGQTVAKIALGLGMHVIPTDLYVDEVELELEYLKIKDATLAIKLRSDSFDLLIKKSDIITIHVPFGKGDQPLIGSHEIAKMKDGVMIINTARGGVVEEKALLEGLDLGKVSFAGLDVFSNEPTPDPKLLAHPKVSLTPHIGANTIEAQERIGIEMAEKIIDFFSN